MKIVIEYTEVEDIEILSQHILILPPPPPNTHTHTHNSLLFLNLSEPSRPKASETKDKSIGTPNYYS